MTGGAGAAIGAPRLRIATFNVENLFSRFDFSGRAGREKPLVGGYSFDDPRQFDMARKVFAAVAADDARQLTALAICETEADVVCLQEVESAEALDAFYENYLRPVLRQRFAAATKGLTKAEKDEAAPRFFYDFRHVSPGNDRRGIDVAVLSRFAFSARSHAHVTYADLADAPVDRARLEELGEAAHKKVFRRDCLEIDLEDAGAPMTLFICHFKSLQAQTPRGDPILESLPIRLAEAHAVRRIVAERFGGRPERARWAICGDLNDFREVDGAPSGPHALGPLLDDGFAVNVVERLPPQERWTHYHMASDSHVQLDYVLLSPALAAANPDALPDILRKGQPYRVPRLEGAPRYPRIGWARPKASDHCPVVVGVR